MGILNGVCIDFPMAKIKAHVIYVEGEGKSIVKRACALSALSYTSLKFKFQSRRAQPACRSAPRQPLDRHNDRPNPSIIVQTALLYTHVGDIQLFAILHFSPFPESP